MARTRSGAEPAEEDNSIISEPEDDDSEEGSDEDPTGDNNSDESEGEEEDDNNNPATFALVPAAVTQGFHDYRTSKARRLFQDSIKNLYDDSSEMFDCEPMGLLDFLRRVEDRSVLHGFDGIMKIPGNDANKTTRHFMTSFGAIKLSDIRRRARTYANAETRKTQDSQALYHCLMNSLSTTGRNKVSNLTDDYTIKGTRVGMLLLKVIVRESGIDTQASGTYIRKQLADLDVYMGTVASDILKFNLHVTTLI